MELYRKFSSVKLLLLVSIHFAWHQVTILEEEREEGGGGAWAPMAPPLDPPLLSIIMCWYSVVDPLCSYAVEMYTDL